MTGVADLRSEEKAFHSGSFPGNFSHARLFALTLGMAGLQFCWSVQIGYVTRTLLRMHLARKYVSLAWLAGPIAGIVVQPIVGVLSDRCTLRMGRRRPFLIGGSLISLFALFAFAYAPEIGAALSINPLSIAVSSFWALDFSMNAAQGPLRTLMADVVPSEQQQLGNAYFAFMTGTGSFSGNMLGSLPLANIIPLFTEDVQALYVIAILVLTLTMSTTVLVTKEEPLSRLQGVAKIQYDSVSAHEDPLETRDGGAGHVGDETSELMSPTAVRTSVASNKSVKGLTAILRESPIVVREVFIMQCFTWFSWFALFIFATSWVGSEVYNGRADATAGSPERALYDAGVRAGNFGLALQSVVAAMFALVLPRLVRAFSARLVLFWSHVCLGVALAMTLTLHHQSDVKTAQFLLAVMGLSWATTMTVPWALVSQAVMREVPGKAGQYLTLFNLSQCLPEVVVSIVAMGVESVLDRQSAMLGLGGAVAFGGGAYALVRRVGE